MTTINNRSQPGLESHLRQANRNRLRGCSGGSEIRHQNSSCVDEKMSSYAAQAPNRLTGIGYQVISGTRLYTVHQKATKEQELEKQGPTNRSKVTHLISREASKVLKLEKLPRVSIETLL
ncbi:uncharacterized protein LOC110865839 isoform X1 [Helianthus annuus]|uniref:uncharacterized protein LOC110865839 isoform X1 n=1 Tax=Helianthus annuus TaxID=4232 RepID=UPI000B9013D1|nr:uncharacterized protein LOC110865839 isoform X1 [Helianthus annuus]